MMKTVLIGDIMKIKHILLLSFLLCMSLSTLADWVPGTIICHSPAISKVYLGSPAIAILPNGDYVAKCDEFGPKATVGKTLLFTSKDKGRTWIKLPEVNNMNWASLFTHKEALYLIGTSKDYKAVVIRRSVDGGKTWTVPKDKNTGILLDKKRYHCAPVPVVEHNGRLWRGWKIWKAPEDTGGVTFEPL